LLGSPSWVQPSLKASRGHAGAHPDLLRAAEAAAGADLPQFVKDEFGTFLECDILAQGFLRPRS
jgi:hypothetical protein